MNVLPSARHGGRRRVAAGAGATVAALVALGAPLAHALPARSTASPAAVGLAATGSKHKVTWDHSSLLIDGQRQFIWSGEFHYWRLPSPDLWRDVLEKMKAAGFNATSIYFDKLLQIAEEVGSYVIARPGPYINAESAPVASPAGS